MKTIKIHKTKCVIKLSVSVSLILTLLTLCGCTENASLNSDISEKSEQISEQIENTQKVPFANVLESNFNNLNNSWKKQVPAGYVIFDSIKGDLNKDGIEDIAVVVKATDEEKVVINRFDQEVDRNRRGLMIFLAENDDYDLVIKSLNCFSSENEDGGVYYAPQLSLVIEGQKLFINYHHGRYGYWKYTFRNHKAGFELIGYNSTSSRGPVILREISMNFSTKKKLTRENINQDSEETNDEVFKETWESLEIDSLLKLSEIVDFDELDINGTY